MDNQMPRDGGRHLAGMVSDTPADVQSWYRSRARIDAAAIPDDRRRLGWAVGLTGAGLMATGLALMALSGF